MLRAGILVVPQKTTPCIALLRRFRDGHLIIRAIMIHHVAFGLRVSATERIPGLTVLESTNGTTADLQIWIRRRPEISGGKTMLFNGLDRHKVGIPIVE